MELPPSGWYPDPQGVPGLLRWWDGSVWTQHTHQGTGTDAARGAVPATTVQPGAQATTVQPAVRPGAQPTTVQPAVQPGRPPGMPPGGQPAFMPPQGQDANSTQVLFLGDDAWSTPDGPPQGDPYGYYRAQRRRRMWLMGGLAGGTAVVLLIIALVVNNLGNSHPSALFTHAPTSAAASTPSPSATASATPSPSGSVIDDSSSGLTYTSLPSPWVPNCQGSLNTQGFNWTDGQSAGAGQINGGQTAWYGVACSAPLPQQYGYNGVTDLQNVATNIVNTFGGSYYSPLQHGYQQQVSQPVSISGHAGWEIKFLLTYPNAQSQGMQWTDEEGAVVVADLGASIPPAVFFVSVPGNLGETNVDSLVSSLQLTNPQQPGGGGSPGDGSPGDGGNGDGGGH